MEMGSSSASRAKLSSVTSSSLVLNKSKSISDAMPSSPLATNTEKNIRISIGDVGYGNGTASVPAGSLKHPKFYSVPKHKSNQYAEAIAAGPPADRRHHGQNGSQSFRHPNQKSFDDFKTWSGRLERQFSVLRGKRLHEETHSDSRPHHGFEILPAARYFDALQGPELDTLKNSEELILPQDQKWPFLLRFPISAFGICAGLSSQSILWKALASAPSTKFLHVSLSVNLILWIVSVAFTAIITAVYAMKVIFYFEAVQHEYYHPVRTTFFFAPWITFLFLVLGLPPSLEENLHPVYWYILMAPIFFLELKVYGQWMSGGERSLSKVANPLNHLSVIGNFTGALLGASMGLKEGPIFFFAIGMVFYLVLFVTLYQRLPTNETLPKDLHPVFFLFFATPSVASTAWARIQGDFDYVSRITYFLALFLFLSLAVRVNFFIGFRFSLAWWSYTISMTSAATATITYSNEVYNITTRALSVLLASISSIILIALFILTSIHAFILRDLFPNDAAIAISRKRIKRKKKHSKPASLSTRDEEAHV